MNSNNTNPTIGEIVLFQSDETISIEVKLDPEHDTVWLSQSQMAELYGTQRQAITKHIKNIYDSSELQKEATCSILELVQKEGRRMVRRNVEYYNLDMIISVGYRVNTHQGIKFRQWANKILKENLLHGCSINHQLVAMQERIDDRFCQLENRISKTEDQINFFIRTNVPPIEGIFYEGQVLDARVFAENLIRVAQREIILVDNYIDSRTFDILEMRNPDVEATIFVEHVGNGMRMLQATAQTQTGRLIMLSETKQRVHDRFIIIDDAVYHLGASLNDLGKRLFAFSRLQMPKSVILNMIKGSEGENINK